MSYLRAALRHASRLPASPWFAYPAIAAVQCRSLWGLWDKDVTGGDTAYYFGHADLWYGDREVDLAWSPLYATFFGTVRLLVGGDAVAATAIHRAVVVLVLALLVLALLRRLLPAPAALIVACWWAALPSVYDSLYEVHLFAAIPLVVAALLMTDEPGPWRRGAVIGLLVASVVLVRNEAAVVLGGFALALAVFEIRARRGGHGTAPGHLVASLGVPLLVALALAGLAYSRSHLEGDDLRRSFRDKHALNVCQTYAVNYQQRHPTEVTGNAFTECRALMARIFGRTDPGFREAWLENPRAMAAATAWNLHLLPAGIQLALFNAASGRDNPDYGLPRLGAAHAAVLLVLLLELLIAGAWALWRTRDAWRRELHPDRWAWLMLGLISFGTVVWVASTRPRPSWMFGLTLTIMALAGLALAVLARHFGRERPLGVASVALPLALVLFLPVHYREGPTPIADQYERLGPIVDGLREPTLVVPNAGGETCLYTAPNRACRGLTYAADVKPHTAGRPLADVLASVGADVLYVDVAMASDPPVGRLLADPRAAGWRVAGSGGAGGDRWTVLVRGR